tara:strand:- start:301 stop:1983 length:1683 start_codon:yes stop_codon:yes gene_type:complete
MISVSFKKWEEYYFERRKVEKYIQDFNISEILAKLFIKNNFDIDEIYSVNEKINFSNIFSNNCDFELASKIIINSIKNKDKILIVGDYDVDGSTATSLLVKFFKSINHPHVYYIPDRTIDGYGVSKKLFQKLVLKDIKLIVMVDCGSTSNEAIEYLNQKSIKSIIVDHHEIQKPFPKSNCIINPKKDNGYIKFNYFCATTLVFFLIYIISKKVKSNFSLKDNLVYVLLATVCDVMPIRKINRFIALKVLNNFDVKKDIFLSYLFKKLDIKSKLKIDDFAYLIGPILNSGGRLNKSKLATQLLSSNDLNDIKKLSNELILLNDKRKILESIALKSINYESLEKKNNDIIIHYDKEIPEGLIGIISARITENLNKPSIVITQSKNILKGSARSIFDFDMGRIIQIAKNKNILISGGGHLMAAGFTLKKDKINSFIDFLNTKKVNYKKKFFYISKISSLNIKKNFIDSLNKIEPFGNGNEIPIFLLENVTVKKPKILKKNHILCLIKTNNDKFYESIAFNAYANNIGKHLLYYKKKINILCQLKLTDYKNQNKIQIIIKDLII